MPSTEKRIRNRKARTQSRAEAARRAAAEARGSKTVAPKKKVVAKKKAAPRRQVQNRAPTPAQKVRSISGDGTRAQRIKELERKIRELQGK